MIVMPAPARFTKSRPHALDDRRRIEQRRRAARPGAATSASTTPCSMSRTCLLPIAVSSRSLTGCCAIATAATRSAITSTIRSATCSGSVVSSGDGDVAVAGDDVERARVDAASARRSDACRRAPCRPPRGARRPGRVPAATVTNGRSVTPPAVIAAGPAVMLSSSSPAALSPNANDNSSIPGTATPSPMMRTEPAAGFQTSEKSPIVIVSVVALAVTVTPAGTKLSTSGAMP